MAVAATGALSFSAIAAEFGGAGPLRMSDFYRGAGPVPAVGAPNLGIPTTGSISFADFRGGAKSVVVSYEMIGGGGGGGFGVGDGGSSGRGPSGGASSLSANGATFASAAGGLGGLNGQVGIQGEAGQGSAYGPGGPRGGANSAGGAAPASSYGAGGGGGGGDDGDTYDSSGNGGGGGQAGTRVTGTVTLNYGTTVLATIGARGLGAAAGYPGGPGAAGFSRLVWDDKSASFTASGSRVIN